MYFFLDICMKKDYNGAVNQILVKRLTLFKRRLLTMDKNITPEILDLVKESEDLSEILWLLFHFLIEDIILSPLNLIVLIQVVGFKKFSLKLNLIEFL